eukprot:scaffold100121_cov23-Tisochrysis_lutea.AAC.2
MMPTPPSTPASPTATPSTVLPSMPPPPVVAHGSTIVTERDGDGATLGRSGSERPAMAHARLSMAAGGGERREDNRVCWFRGGGS